jgi:sulfatase modifying factor 1
MSAERVGNVIDATAKARWPFFRTIGASDGYAFTCPAGRYKPNAFGLYDMHGNAAEWCADWCDEEYYAHAPGDDPAGPSTGSYRLLRGGSWAPEAAHCRSASRVWNSQTYRSPSLGFRVARNSGP